MDKVNKQELARLIGSLEAYAKIAKPEYQWMPQTVFALLDELERAAERNVALGAELEQYRKDALRYRWLCDQPGFQLWLDGVLRDEEINSTGLDVDIDIDALMAKEGGANG